ncbi:hypothetical protein BL253_29410 [Pseudofrankia asymbiotica]|uniref:Uncharacterized protein n=1 Tax=Pseudofrankia asymbiotica TaxID=1834516 RepID=A0A1V2I410_9ACTN|nr:hypothetical protein BL253_29410 [Pseudofrankia asymbiotica]
MTHHYSAERQPPADAPHRAQRWALDPGGPLSVFIPDELMDARDGRSTDDSAGWTGRVRVGV